MALCVDCQRDVTQQVSYQTIPVCPLRHRYRFPTRAVVLGRRCGPIGDGRLGIAIKSDRVADRGAASGDTACSLQHTIAFRIVEELIAAATCST